jgi:hypothetical protein
MKRLNNSGKYTANKGCNYKNKINIDACWVCERIDGLESTMCSKCSSLFRYLCHLVPFTVRGTGIQEWIYDLGPLKTQLWDGDASRYTVLKALVISSVSNYTFIDIKDI